jgi:hypothetical protein
MDVIFEGTAFGAPEVSTRALYNHLWLKNLNAGESAFLPGVKTSDKIFYAARAYAVRTLGYKLRARSVDGGLRVWRIV